MKTKLFWIGGIVLVVLFVVWLAKTPGKPGKYDEFATCLKDRGAIFYGAFWCPHCKNQKALFGRSAALLPYQECSTPDGNDQLKVCADAGIVGYPTWVYADGTKSGQMTLEELAAKTSCVLPQ